MAEGFSSAEADDAIDALLATYTWVQLHTAAPGAAGTANVATETDRQQATWGAASAGAAANTAALTWESVAATEDYTHFSVWTAATNGTFGFSGTITANQVTSGDDFTVAIGDLDVTLPVAS